MHDELVRKIKELKKERNAVLLVHNYQRPEIQDLADYLGDSLGLSQQAAATQADVIVFCGVHFMAETASILCPDKTVLIPEREAGCPMADMITPAQLREIKQEHPQAKVVTYVNSTAEIKAESDVCCTSANALKVVQAVDADQVIFVPDQHLGAFVARQTDKEVILWKGYCPSHVRILPEHVQGQKEEHPQAKVLVHPECPPAVIDLADEALSTEGMCRYVKAGTASEFLIGTEPEMVYRLRKENPDKKIWPVTQLADCPDMKKNTLEKVLWSLEETRHVVKVPDKIAKKAKGAIGKMLEYTRSD